MHDAEARTHGAPEPFYVPDLVRLRGITANARPASHADTSELLESAGKALPLESVASLLKGILAPEGGHPVASAVKARAARVRGTLFGDSVVPMAPVEVANTCASDCVFCGWRVSNRAMQRLRMPVDLAMMQVDYLVDLGIHYIEFVSGDDIAVVRKILPELIRETRSLFAARGVDGRICFCTLALTERQYRELREAGADSMIVWQEAYDPDVYCRHIIGGPKAHGITDDWQPVQGGDGWRFRVEAQERALRAGLDVALGSMLGLNPDIVTEFLATVDHARYLASAYGATGAHPIVIGMPIWNAITTRETDLRPGYVPDLVTLFPVLAALYLLALPDEGVWIFPNCRVPMEVQVEAARVAGAFSSTEVKLGPGGYLPAIIRRMQAGGEDTLPLQKRVAAILREAGEDVDELARALDEREQFVHHYHAHDVYRSELERAGLKLVRGVRIAVCPGACPSHSSSAGRSCS